MVNLWMPYSAELRDAFGTAGGLVPSLACRAFSVHLGRGRLRVLDVGGGFGNLAARLARLGHDVTVLDLDPAAVDAAGARLAAEPSDVRERVALVVGGGQEATRLAGADCFDLVCCHSVLMYESSPERLIGELVRACRPGGWVSIVSVDPESCAMRPGLQGRWLDAIGSLTSGRDVDGDCLPTVQHSRRFVERVLGDAGARVAAWYGIGVFTDHLGRDLTADEAAAAVEAEWWAGRTDPYRSVARCYHLMAQRGDGPDHDAGDGAPTPPPR